jgi:hypothetical protein
MQKYAVRYSLLVRVDNLCSCPMYSPKITYANPIMKTIMVRLSWIMLPCLDCCNSAIIVSRRGLNDLGEKYLKMIERVIEDPSIRRVIDNEAEVSQEGAYSFYILWICSHAYAMHKRNILDDNE